MDKPEHFNLRLNLSHLTTAIASLTLLASLGAPFALAQPVVTNCATSIYATVPDPLALSFGLDGSLYAGRDNAGSGGGNADAVKIHRIGPGGSPVTEFGNVTIPDPDAVIVDRAGTISGIAGAVLVGGQTSPGIGQVSRIAQDGTVTALFGPSSLYWNPSGFAFDSLGRLLFTESAQGRVYRSDGGTPVLLFNLSDAYSIASDAADRIVVSPGNNPGRLVLYSTSGTLSDANFAAVRLASPLARGPGGMWTTDLYAITDGGDLIRIGLDGTTNKVGSGFGSTEGMAFGPDGALYASDFTGDRIWRVAPVVPPPVMQGLKLHLDAGNINGDGSNPAEGTWVNPWRDLSGLGLDLTPPVFPGPTVCLAPVYRTNALNGRPGVDFGQSGSDALATAFSGQLNFTNCTIVMVCSGANTGTHISISAANLMQEFCIYDKGIQHHSSPYHYIYRSHQAAPAGFYVHAALFGVKPGQLGSFINGVASTNGLVFGQQSPTLNDVADYAPVARQAVLGWRNSNAAAGAPVASENFGAIICELLVYGRELSTPELDAMNFYFSRKYGLAVTPFAPTLRVARTTPGNLAFQWDAALGRAYQVQTATSLSPANWTNLGSSLVASNSPVLVTNSIGADPARFFRVKAIGN